MNKKVKFNENYTGIYFNTKILFLKFLYLLANKYNETHFVKCTFLNIRELITRYF